MLRNWFVSFAVLCINSVINVPASSKMSTQTKQCTGIIFPSNTGGSDSFRLHEILQTAYLLGALEVMADSVIISQKMNIYLDLLVSSKEKVSINHLFFACCFMHCKTIY